VKHNILLFTPGLTVLVLGVAMWLSRCAAVEDCRQAQERAEESAKLVPYQTVTLCKNGFAAHPGWLGWTCGCAP
jgi:hypothetical protein